MPTTTSSTVDLQQLEAETEAARHRSGRTDSEVLADLVHVGVYIGELAARDKAMVAQANADNRATEAAMSRPRIVQFAGGVTRQTPAADEKDQLLAAYTTRTKQRVEALRQYREELSKANALAAALLEEGERAGLPAEKARSLVAGAKVTRKAAA